MNGTGLSFSTPVQSTGKFRTIRPWKFPEIHTGIFGRMVSAKGSPPASLPFKGQVTEQATVKLPMIAYC